MSTWWSSRVTLSSQRPPSVPSHVAPSQFQSQGETSLLFLQGGHGHCDGISRTVSPPGTLGWLEGVIRGVRAHPMHRSLPHGQEGARSMWAAAPATLGATMAFGYSGHLSPSRLLLGDKENLKHPVFSNDCCAELTPLDPSWSGSKCSSL